MGRGGGEPFAGKGWKRGGGLQHLPRIAGRRGEGGRENGAGGIGGGRIGGGRDSDGTGRHDPLDLEVVDRDVVMAWPGIEIEDEMGDDGAGEIPGGAMFGPQRRQALPQRRGDVGDPQRLPAIGAARHVPGHEDGHRRAGPRRPEAREDDPGGETDVGAVGPHPE